MYIHICVWCALNDFSIKFLDFSLEMAKRDAGSAAAQENYMGHRKTERHICK